MEEKATLKSCRNVHSLPSSQFDERPAGVTIDTVVVHSMYARFKPDMFSPHHCKETLDEAGVSAHYLVDRKGEIWELVDPVKRAWHAGESRMPWSDDSRPSVNAFSVGVELFATEDSGYTAEQKESLVEIVRWLSTNFPIAAIVGHNHIAPHRKTDPWSFSWDELARLLKAAGVGPFRMPGDVS